MDRFEGFIAVVLMPLAVIGLGLLGSVVLVGWPF